MPDAPAGFFVAKVGMLGSQVDPEPFALDCDFGSLPSSVIVSAWRHSAADTEAPPVGDAVLELVGNDMIASGRLWVEIQRGADTASMLNRLGARARFSVSYLILNTRAPTSEERRRGVVRVLTAVRLLELSAVLVPAEPTTRLVELKSTHAEADAVLKEWRDIARMRARVTNIRTEQANREAAALFHRHRRTA